MRRDSRVESSLQHVGIPINIAVTLSDADDMIRIQATVIDDVVRGWYYWHDYSIPTLLNP